MAGKQHIPKVQEFKQLGRLIKQQLDRSSKDYHGSKW